jgi:hypothetical protein
VSNGVMIMNSEDVKESQRKLQSTNYEAPHRGHVSTFLLLRVS